MVMSKFSARFLFGTDRITTSQRESYLRERDVLDLQTSLKYRPSHTAAVSYSLSSHVTPVNPGVQMHVKVLTSSTHVPLTQGWDRHSSISKQAIDNKQNIIDSYVL